MRHPGARLCAAVALALVLAAPAGAQPGFTTYLIGFMTRGSGKPADAERMPQLQKSHLANLDAMWKEGLLLASGPIADKGDLRGVMIFRGDQREMVEKRVADDPLVKVGSLEVALGPWIGPAGMGDEYMKWAAANPGVPDKMRAYQLVMLRTVWGAARITQAEQQSFLQHMDTAVKSGKLAVAGPVLEGSDLAWVLVFTSDAAETDALVASIPQVRAGKMTAERHPWMVAEGVLPAGFKVPMQ